MSQYFQVTKIVKSLITCLDFVQACLCVKVKLFLQNFRVFMGFLLKPKRPFFNPSFVPGFSQVDYQPCKSTCTEVGRPARSTDVHRRARLCALVDGRPCRSTAPESSALRKVRPTVPVDRQRVHSLLQLLGRPGRSTGGSNGRILDRWRSTGPVDRQY